MAASGVIGALRVVLGIDTAAWEEGLSGVRRSMAQVGRQMTQAGQTLTMGVSAPLAALGALTLKTAGDFESGMSRVQAATGATASEFQAMEDMARQIGKTTIFSAQEAADAMEVLAKNGLNVSQILDGAAEASLTLAAATGGDMAASADIATDVMLSFGKEAKDLGGVVDGITGVLLKSKFGFDDYRLAIGQAGGVAGGLGVEFEDFNAAIVATSSLFASGSDAGTSFKTFLTSLPGKSGPATKAIEELGLEFYEADGSMKSMAEVAGELRTGLAGLSEEAKAAYLTDIFGTDAMRTAIGLANTTAEGFREIEDAIADASATEQAEARMGPFNAALKEMGNQFKELQIAIGKSGLLDFVTKTVAKVAEWTNYLSEANPAILKWGVVIAGISAALGPVLIALGLAVTAFAAISFPVFAAIAAVGAATAAFAYFYDDVVPILSAFADRMKEALGHRVTAVLEALKVTVGQVRQAINEAFSIDIGGEAGAFLEDVKWVAGQIVEFWSNRLVAGLSAGLEVVKTVIQGFGEAFRGLMALVQGDFQTYFDSILNIGQIFADGLTAIFDALFPGIRTMVVTTLGEIKTAFIDLKDSAVQAMTDMMAGIKAAIFAPMEAIRGHMSNQLDLLKKDWEQFADILVWNSVVPDMVEEIGRWMDMLPALMGDPAKAATDSVTGAMSGMEDIGRAISQSLSGSFKGLIDGTKTFKDVIGDLLGSLSDMWMDKAFQAIFGGGTGGGGGGLLGGLFGGLGSLLGFKGGGSFNVGGAGGMDSQLVAFRASPNETVSITKPGQDAGAAGGRFAVEVVPSPYFDVRVQKLSDQVASRRVAQGQQQSARQAPAMLADRQRRGI